MASKFNTIFMIWAFALCAFIQPAQAQKIKDLFEKKMPEVERMSQAEFEAQTYLYDDVPYSDKTLAYEIRLPKDWSTTEHGAMSNYNMSNRLLGHVAHFYSPPRIDAARSRFTIMAVNLEYEMTAEQWFLQHVLSNGFTLEGIEIHDGRKVEALHVYLHEGDTFVVRTVAQINGRRMILAQLTSPAQYWHREKVLSYEVMQSFKMLSPEVTLIENFRTHQFLDLVEFDYPESWTVNARPITNTDRMEVLLENIRKETNILDGQIYVEVLSSYVVDDVEKELDKLKRKLNRQGLLVGNLMETRDDIYFHKDVDFGFAEVYEARDTENDLLSYELWVAAMASKEYYFFIYLVTPHRDTDFFIWARNTGAFKSMTRFMHPLVREELIMDEDAPVDLR